MIGSHHIHIDRCGHHIDPSYPDWYLITITHTHLHTRKHHTQAYAHTHKNPSHMKETQVTLTYNLRTTIEWNTLTHIQTHIHTTLQKTPINSRNETQVRTVVKSRSIYDFLNYILSWSNIIIISTYDMHRVDHLWWKILKTKKPLPRVEIL